MIYLLHGSDTQGSQQKLKEIIAEYYKRADGGFDFHKFDAEEDDFSKLKEALKGGSLFTQKKLLVIKYLSLSKWSREELFKLLKKSQANPGITVIFWDRELAHEDVLKLKPFCAKIQEFKKANVALPARENKEIFKLGDTFFTYPQEGAHLLLELLRRGEDPMKIFSYLANHLRTLVAVKHAEFSKKRVPAGLKMHPYVAEKAAQTAARLPFSKLHYLQNVFLEEEYKIKSGQAMPEESLFRLLSGI